MEKYIDAEMFVCSLDGSECLDTERDYEEIAKRIDEFEAADVEKVRHGQWIDTGVNTFRTRSPIYKCSLCNELEPLAILQGQIIKKYCPYCGARMNGGKE